MTLSLLVSKSRLIIAIKMKQKKYEVPLGVLSDLWNVFDLSTKALAAIHSKNRVMD